jgi:hypothetical protein
MATHKPPPPKRSYEQYEELGPLFVGANASIKEGDLEQAAEDLNSLSNKAMMMWGPPLPIHVTDLSDLKKDVEDGNTAPPAGDFARRLNDLRDSFKSEYEKDRRRSEIRGEDYASEGKPDPPPFLESS